MRVTVPVETPVYFRRCARERYVLRHVSRSGYVRHMPLSLSVSDLRGHLVCEEQRVERENVPVLVLLTGKRALVYTLGNWSCPKKAVVLGPSEFSKGFAPVGGGELVESHFLLRSYTHLTTYCVRQGRYLPRDTSFFEAAGELRLILLHLHSTAPPEQGPDSPRRDRLGPPTPAAGEGRGAAGGGVQAHVGEGAGERHVAARGRQGAGGPRSLQRGHEEVQAPAGASGAGGGG